MSKSKMNLSDQTILITGSTDGIGKETARILLEFNAHVILHGRNPQRLQASRDELQSAFPQARIDSVRADFASLSQVRQMAAEVLERFPRLDVLINNAGIYPSQKQLSEDGFELTLQTNYLAPFLLTNLLRPLLIKSAPARIVNLSSIGHRFVWDNLHDPKSNLFFWRWVAYCRSKLLVIPFTMELAEQLRPHEVWVNCLHPGIIRTKIIRFLPVSWGASVHSGAQTVVNLASNPNLEGMTGKYIERYHMSKPAPLTRRPGFQARLWKKSLAWAGLRQEADGSITSTK